MHRNQLSGGRCRGQSRHYRSSFKPAGLLAHLPIRYESLEPRTMLATLASGEEAFDSFGIGFSESFEIHANAGDSIWISVGETGDLSAEPLLQVFNPAGQSVDFDNGANDAIVRTTNAVAGTYTAIVSDNSNDEAMSFRIRAVTLPSNPQLIAGRDNVLASGEEFAASFPLGSFNVFPIEVNEGDSLYVSVGETGDLSAQPLLYLYDSAGQLVTFDSSADDAVIRIADALAGTYTAVVADNNNDQPMSFRIRAFTTPSAPLLIAGRDNALTSGEEFEASFPLGSFNVFPIEVNQGDSLYVSVGETGDLTAEPVLYLYDSVGRLVTFDNSPSDALIRIADVVAGTYTAIVADNNNDEPMSFRIRAVTLPSNPQLIAGRDKVLASGEEFEASFPLGLFNVFPIEVNEGDSLYVSVGETGDLAAQPLLYLYDSAGRLVTFDGSADDAVIRIADALAGTYTAIVADNNNDQPMSFRIRAVTAPSAPLLIAGRDKVLASGEEFEASFPLGSFNVFPIEANAGDSLYVSVGETGDLSAQPLLYLYDSVGRLVTFDTSSNDAVIRIADALAGTYTAIVADNNNDQPMSFRIRAVTAPSAPLLISGRDKVLASGEEFEASFPLGSFNVFPIEANAGDSLIVSVGETGDLASQPLLYLYDSAGRLVTFDNGPDDAVIRITDALAGTYTALVADGNNDQPMSSRIRAVTLPSAPLLIAGRDQQLTAGLPWEATSPLGSFNVYRFDTRIGDDVEIELAKIDGPGSPSFRVYDPAGELITFNSSSTVAVGTFEAGAAGIYTVIVNDSSNSQSLHHRMVVNGNTGTFSPIRARQVFYNNSAFDLTSDDHAIAEKQPLLPGSASSFANFTSFLGGVNGVMIDLADAPSAGSIVPADFSFRTGKTSDTSTWNEMLAVPAVDIREGEAADGSDRISLIWPDGTIANTWLEVTLRATANTGLAADHVFYFGNLIGDASGDGQVNATDYALVRANPANFLTPADVDNLFDMNRDGRVNADDLTIIRDHATLLGTGLPAITPSGALGMLAEGESEPLIYIEERKPSVAASRSEFDGVSLPIDEAIAAVAVDSRNRWLAIAERAKPSGSLALLDDDEWPALDLEGIDQLPSEP